MVQVVQPLPLRLVWYQHPQLLGPVSYRRRTYLKPLCKLTLREKHHQMLELAKRRPIALNKKSPCAFTRAKSALFAAIPRNLVLPATYLAPLGYPSLSRRRRTLPRTCLALAKGPRRHLFATDFTPPSHKTLLTPVGKPALLATEPPGRNMGRCPILLAANLADLFHGSTGSGLSPASMAATVRSNSWRVRKPPSPTLSRSLFAAWRYKRKSLTTRMTACW